jgi:hypothetical protein
MEEKRKAALAAATAHTGTPHNHELAPSYSLFLHISSSPFFEHYITVSFSAFVVSSGGGGLPSHSPVPAYRPSQPTSIGKPAPPYPPPQQRP